MKVLICGYGSTGKYAVDMLARLGLEDMEIHIMSRKSAEEIAPRLNTTVISAMIMENVNPIVYHACSMTDVEAMAGLFSEIGPDIIAYTGRYISNVKYGSFSYPNGIGYGVWTPLSVPLIYNVMKAVKKSGIQSRVIDTSHPDIVEPLLKSVGMNVLTGLGNINHMVPRIKRYISAKLDVPLDAVDVSLICSHFLNTYACRDGKDMGSPYYLEYCIRGKKGMEIGNDELIQACHIPMVSDSVRNLMIASDTVEVIRILLGKNPVKIHLPGPNGMIGGYPCRVYPLAQRDDIEILLPEDVSMEKAVHINEVSSQYDGIEKIKDGMLTFMDKDIRILKNVFDLDYPKSIHIEECQEFAGTVAEKLMEYRG